MSFVWVKLHMHIICFFLYLYLPLLFFKNKQITKKSQQGLHQTPLYTTTASQQGLHRTPLYTTTQVNKGYIRHNYIRPQQVNTKRIYM